MLTKARTIHDAMANTIRVFAREVRSSRIADGRGRCRDGPVHPFLKFDPDEPRWPDRDRFVLSAGHGLMLFYALLHLLGYPEMTIEQLKRFRHAPAEYRRSIIGLAR